MDEPANLTRRALLCGAAGLGALASVACGARATENKEGDEQIVAEIRDTLESMEADQQDAPIDFLDMHADTIDVLGMKDYVPYKTLPNKFSGTLTSTNAQVSIDRMGDLRWAQCYAVWLPDEEGPEAGDIAHVDWYRNAVKWFKGQMKNEKAYVTQAKKLSDIPAIFDKGKVAAVLTVENAACLDAGLEMVDEFAKDGVLIAGFTWNYRNVLGSGLGYPEEGLTDLGRQYLAELESHNILADVSHLNDKGFWEVEKLAKKPYVATHSNARAVCGAGRNLTDEQFDAIAARGGLVGLNFNDGFVHDNGSVYTFEELSAHVEHWLDRGGEDIVAFGTDRDGSAIPTWLADCSSQRSLFDRFSERLGEDIARKLFFENAMRLFDSLA